MADDDRFLEEIAPFLDAVHEPLAERWSSAFEQSGSFVALDASPLAELVDAERPLDDATHWSAPDAAAISCIIDTSTAATSTTAGSSNEDTNREQESSSPKPTRRRRAKRSRNTTRENMQSELKQLRSQSTELQQRLAALRHQQQLQQGDALLQAPSKQGDLLLVATWERIAKRRLEERTRAVAENVRLKNQVEHQTMLARNLQQSVCHLASLAFGNPSAFNRSDCIRADAGVYASAEDLAICDMLVGELNDTYARLDRVFQENGLSAWQADPSTTTSSKVNMKTRRSHTGEDPLYMELIDIDVVPYDMELAFGMSWYCWEQRFVAKNGVLYDHMPANVSAYKGRIEISLHGERIALEYLNVTKWYRDKGCNNCVWRGITKVDSHFPGVYMNESGWQVIKSVDDQVDGETASRTAILACSQFECKRLGGSSVSLEETQACQLAKLAVSMYETDVLEVNNMMMNMVVKDPVAEMATALPTVGSPPSQHTDSGVEHAEV